MTPLDDDLDYPLAPEVEGAPSRHHSGINWPIVLLATGLGAACTAVVMAVLLAAMIASQ